MSVANKMAVAAFFLLNIIVLSNAHSEHRHDLQEVDSEIEEDVSEDARVTRHHSRRRHAHAYEGLPIDMPRRRNPIPEEEDDHEGIVPETTTQTTETDPPPTKSTPPMDFRYRRIFDPDETAAIEDYPFMAAVLVNKEFWCGAAIIEKDRVLTAAHCLQLQYNNRFFREYVKMLTVRVGSSNATAGGEVLRVVEIAFHPNYKPATLEFNVAVLKLHKNLTLGLDPPISEIDVARETVVPSDYTIKFLGWGSVLGGGGIGGAVLLQQVDLPVYDYADCQVIYGNELVRLTNFCAGYISKKKNVCNHDAGGPAVIGDKLVGILSFSARRCDNLDKPAVFTTVGSVVPWLDSLTQPKTGLNLPTE